MRKIIIKVYKDLYYSRISRTRRYGDEWEANAFINGKLVLWDWGKNPIDARRKIIQKVCRYYRDGLMRGHLVLDVKSLPSDFIGRRFI